MFSTMNDFIRDRCTDAFLLDCLQYMQYPFQYVTKCDKADKKLTFIGYTEISQIELRDVFEKQEADRIAMEDVIDERQDAHRKLIREQRESGDYSNEGRFFGDIIDDWHEAGKPMGSDLESFLEGE